MSAIPIVAQGTNGAALVRAHSKFFFGMSIVLLLFVLSGFAPTLYLRAFFDVPPIPVHLYLHGGILTGWFVWLVVQTSLVRTGRTATHRRLGVVGVVWAAAVVAGGLLATLKMVAHAVADGIDLNADISSTMPYVGVSGVTVAAFMSNLVWANIASVGAFAILVTSAVLLRGRPQAHKRLMLIASITIIGGALSILLGGVFTGVMISPFGLALTSSLQ